MRRSVFAAVLALTAFVSAQASTSIFTESVDAGDFVNPQSVVGSGITQIQGSIGDTDLVDAFKFFFAGGPLAITAYLGNDPLAGLPITLFGEKAAPTDPCWPVDPCRTDPLQLGRLDLSSAFLSAGNYILGVCIPTEPCLPADPPYTISFFVSPTGEAASISAPTVPEPATLALFGLGLAGIAAVRHKKLAA